jgi:hypothetical protein
VIDVNDGADVDVNLLHGTISRSPRSCDLSGESPVLPIVSELFTSPSGTRDSGATEARVVGEPTAMPQGGLSPGLGRLSQSRSSKKSPKFEDFACPSVRQSRIGGAEYPKWIILAGHWASPSGSEDELDGSS